MAQQQKDLLARLADAGEDAIQRLAKAPGGKSMLDVVNQSRERLDELQKRMRGLDALEKRVAQLEAQVKGLSKPAAPRAAKKPAPKKPAA